MLLVAVSDITLGYNINTNLPLYARARIPEVWIVDLERVADRSSRYDVGVPPYCLSLNPIREAFQVPENLEESASS